MHGENIILPLPIISSSPCLKVHRGSFFLLSFHLPANLPLSALRSLAFPFPPSGSLSQKKVWSSNEWVASVLVPVVLY